MVTRELVARWLDEAMDFGCMVKKMMGCGWLVVVVRTLCWYRYVCGGIDVGSFLVFGTVRRIPIPPFVSSSRVCLCLPVWVSAGVSVCV
jgi:hypothetical protein